MKGAFMMKVYADNAATTMLSRVALDAMMPYLTDKYANASSAHSAANESRRAINNAREKVAAALGASSAEIYFTSGGTEADNLAIKGVALQKGSGHIITSKIEHHAVLYTVEYLEKLGFTATYLDVDEDGRLNPADVEAAIRPDTILISIMAANNEIGTIEPIAEIGKIARAHGVLFHTDAVQAVGHIPVNVGDWNVDMLSLAAQQIPWPQRRRRAVRAKRHKTHAGSARRRA